MFQNVLTSADFSEDYFVTILISLNQVFNDFIDKTYLKWLVLVYSVIT